MPRVLHFSALVYKLVNVTFRFGMTYVPMYQVISLGNVLLPSYRQKH